MKISYIKHWDNEGNTIKQTIRCENEKENDIKNYFTNFTVYQRKGLYSIGLSALAGIQSSGYFENKRILSNRNTMVELFKN